MRKKRIITIVLSAILFISIAVLGFANVYRVKSVDLQASTISAKAETEAKILRDELAVAYADSNTLFVDRSIADFVVNKNEFSYFRITGFKKVFPNHIVVEVKEDEEMFNLQVLGESYYLGVDGVYLGQEARHDSNNNIEVTGLSAPTALGQVVGGSEKEDGFVAMIKAMSAVDGMGGTLRGNVSSIDVTSPDEIAGLKLMSVKMKEGVVGVIYNFHQDSAQKASRFIEKYLSLEDSQKVEGTIIVATDVYGGLQVDYYPSLSN